MFSELNMCFLGEADTYTDLHSCFQRKKGEFFGDYYMYAKSSFFCTIREYK
jgi:hypothetical protein